MTFDSVFKQLCKERKASAPTSIWRQGGVISTLQMLLLTFKRALVWFFTLSPFCIRAAPISPAHCHILLSVNKTASQENVKCNEKERGKDIKERKLARSCPVGHILTGSASSYVSSTKQQATTSAASAAAIAALVCVTRVLAIKRTPPKAPHNVSPGWQGGRTALLLKITKKTHWLSPFFLYNEADCERNRVWWQKKELTACYGNVMWKSNLGDIRIYNGSKSWEESRKEGFGASNTTFNPDIPEERGNDIDWSDTVSTIDFVLAHGKTGGTCQYEKGGYD